MLQARKPKKSKIKEDIENFILGAEEYPNEEEYPWDKPSLREDVKKTILLYINEIDKAKLQYVAKKTSRSMHQVCLEAIKKELELCIEKIK